MSSENEKLYKKRLTRIQNAINHEPVDKIPCIYMGVAFSPRYMGMTQKQFCMDPAVSMDVTIKAMKRLGDGIDGINSMAFGMITMGLTAMWLSKVLTPGIELDDEALWQVAEKEVMTVEDYDFIINNGYEAFFGKMLPQVCDMEMFGKNMAWVEANLTTIKDNYQSAGYPVISAGATSIPFEALCGARSMNQFFFDLYRIPDKVQEALEVCLPFIIESGKGFCKAAGVSGTWVGGWRSASAMLAPDLWDRFAWPHIKKICIELIEDGITPVLHWDQDWTRDLARLLELPAKKCVLNLDGMTDIRKAKEILNDHTAIMGDVPPATLAAGTPEDVRNYIKDLVHDIGPKGLLLCPGCDAPLNTKPENMEAFVAACNEFG